MDELTKLIDKLVEQKTFSLDALGPIKELRDKADKLQAQLQNSEQRVKERTTEIAELSAKVSLKDSKIKEWETREAVLLKREATITGLEKDTAVAEARTDTLRSVFETIFRNTIVRETINRDTPLVRNSGGGASDYVEQYQTTTETTRQTE